MIEHNSFKVYVINFMNFPKLDMQSLNHFAVINNMP